MDVPKPSNQDVVIKLIKGAIGAVPMAGGLLGELLELFITPQYQKRFEEWAAYVNATLEEIKGQGAINTEELFNNEEWNALFLKNTKAYLNNVETYKKPIFQSYFKATIVKQLALDKKLIFLEIIESLSEVQLQIFKAISKNENDNVNRLYEMKLRENLNDAFAERDQAYLALLLKGLTDYHLLNYVEAKVVEDNYAQRYMITSRIAKEFIAYLSND